MPNGAGDDGQEHRLHCTDPMSKSAPSFLRSDIALAGAVTLCGAIGMVYGVVTQRQPFAMLPGMDGALTAGLLGFGFALLHGLRYRDVLRMLIPVLGIQVGGCLVHGESVVAIIGLELTVVGMVGLALAAALSQTSRRKRRTDRRDDVDRSSRARTAVAAAAIASPASHR
jgi:hypothetical protein